MNKLSKLTKNAENIFEKECLSACTWICELDLVIQTKDILTESFSEN